MSQRPPSKYVGDPRRTINRTRSTHAQNPDDGEYTPRHPPDGFETANTGRTLVGTNPGDHYGHVNSTNDSRRGYEQNRHPQLGMSPTFSAFMQIQFRDFAQCCRFVGQNPGVLREDQDRIQNEVVLIYARGDVAAGDRALDRLMILWTIRKKGFDLDGALNWLNRVNNTRGKDFSEYDKNFEQVKAHLFQKAKEYSSRAGNMYDSSSNTRSQEHYLPSYMLSHGPNGFSTSNAMNGMYSSTHDSNNMRYQMNYSSAGLMASGNQDSDPRFVSGFNGGTNRSHPVPSYNGSAYPSRPPQDQGGLWFSSNNSATVRGEAIEITPRNTVSDTDRGFQVPREGSTFFIPGRVFKVYWAEPRGRPHRSNTNNQHSSSRDNFYHKVMFMLVVHKRHGYSICCPISTYDRQGCNKPGLRERPAEVREHAIIYSTSRPPSPLDNEPPMVKEKIKVDIEPSAEDLLPESRVHFGKYHTVQWNIPVQIVGRICEAQREIVLHYFRQTLGG